MKTLLSLALVFLFLSCGTLKSNPTISKENPTVSTQQGIKKPLPPNTASNKYSANRQLKQ